MIDVRTPFDASSDGSANTPSTRPASCSRATSGKESATKAVTLAARSAADSSSAARMVVDCRRSKAMSVPGQVVIAVLKSDQMNCPVAGLLGLVT